MLTRRDFLTAIGASVIALPLSALPMSLGGSERPGHSFDRFPTMPNRVLFLCAAQRIVTEPCVRGCGVPPGHYSE